MSKNNLKKAIAVALAFGTALSFAACGKNDTRTDEVLTYSAYGYYECMSATKNGSDMTENEFKLLGYDDVALELEKDGTGTYSTATTSHPVTWEDGQIDFGAESPMTFDRIVDRLTLHGESGVDMIFERLADSWEESEASLVRDEKNVESQYLATLWYLDSHLDVIGVYEYDDVIRVIYRVTNDTTDAISPEIEVVAFAGTAEVDVYVDDSASEEPADDAATEELGIQAGETVEYSARFDWSEQTKEEVELCFFIDGLGQGITVALTD